MAQSVPLVMARRIRVRALHRCEYCRFPQWVFQTQRFPIDHILSAQHGGKTEDGNLALSCPHCNSHKGPNIAGYDHKVRKITRLYNPRSDKWHQHFQWDGPYVIGKTAIGRTTIHVLKMNDPIVVATRLELLEEGVAFK